MTRSLNIDSLFVPVPASEIEHHIFRFPGGEYHIKLNEKIDYGQVTRVVITNRFDNMGELMKVAIAKDALERRGIKKFDLVMPYIPYARQDRVCEKYESFTLKVFTDFLNSLNFDVVHVMDPHSDVAPALINNCNIISNIEYVARALVDISDLCYLIIPDTGATKKAQALQKSLNFKDAVQCNKIRDTKTGDLTGFKVYDYLHFGDAPCIIVDDICDGGGTFIGLAEKLKEYNAGDLYLFVTHGIFSKGFEELLKFFTKIYYTNSWISLSNDDFLIQYDIQL